LRGLVADFIKELIVSVRGSKRNLKSIQYDQTVFRLIIEEVIVEEYMLPLNEFDF
jgi:hypothetical protein